MVTGTWISGLCRIQVLTGIKNIYYFKSKEISLILDKGCGCSNIKRRAASSRLCWQPLEVAFHFYKERRMVKMKINGPEKMEIQQVNNNTMNQTAVDSETKSYQNQIASAQSQLQKLSSDNNISQEEKAEKRKEIQKQIMELNNMLREHKMEMRREKQQKAAEASKERQKQEEQQQQQGNVVDVKEDLEPQPERMSSGHMKAIVSADASLERARVQDSVASGLERKISVLEGEIRQSAETGGYVEGKKKEIESLENKVVKISGSKMGTLGSAVQEIRQVSQAVDKAANKTNQAKPDVIKETANMASPDLIAKKQIDMYNKGKFFSNVDIQF